MTDLIADVKKNEDVNLLAFYPKLAKVSGSMDGQRI